LKAELVARVCRALSKRCRVHLEVDTGMQRTGMRVETAIRELPHLRGLKELEWVGIYSHLATADRPSDPVCLQQIAAFSSLTKKTGLLVHIASSGGVVH